MMDCLICSVPRILYTTPPIAPAQLKTYLNKNGFDCETIDFNLDLWYKTGNEYPEIWDNNDLTFFYEDEFEKFFNKILKEIIIKWVDVIVEKNPRFVGFSVFSSKSAFTTNKICYELKSRKTDIKIIVGGASIIYRPDYTKRMIEENLIDYFIAGDGEQALVELLKGNVNYPGINSKEFIEMDLNDIFYPDYSNYELDKYPNIICKPNEITKDKLGVDTLYLVGSKSCTNNCTYCDTRLENKKFQFRSAESIVEELSYQSKKYNIKHFIFNDDLINGSMLNLKKMCKLLIKEKEKTKIQLRLEGQYVCRSQKVNPPEFFDDLRNAGFKLIQIGIESLSEKVRFHMGKRFTNRDLMYTLEQCSRVGIYVVCLVMVGYPNETEKDFQETCDFFKNNTKWRDDKTIKLVCSAIACNISRATELYKNADKFGITFNDDFEWTCGDNTYPIRINRYIRLYELLESLDYNISMKSIKEYRLLQKEKHG